MSHAAPPVPFPVVAIGCSAGGVEALWTLLGSLPAGLEAAVLVVMHIAPHTVTQLDRVLAPRSLLPVKVARDGEVLRAGQVYVAQADRHLLIEGPVVRLSRGPKECRVRPAINVLFRSVAETCGPSAIGVVLSGMLDDGTAGLWSIKQRGGYACVQEPAEALHDGMPRAALEHVDADAVAPAAVLAQRIAEAVREAGAARHGYAGTIGIETRVALGRTGGEEAAMHLGRPTRFACPECHGVLGEIREGSIVRYRCHTGHAYSVQTLSAELDQSIEDCLWKTVRALEEKKMLLEAAAPTGGDAHIGAELARVQRQLEVLRRMILAGDDDDAAPEAPARAASPLESTPGK